MRTSPPRDIVRDSAPAGMAWLARLGEPGADAPLDRYDGSWARLEPLEKDIATQYGVTTPLEPVLDPLLERFRPAERPIYTLGPFRDGRFRAAAAAVKGRHRSLTLACHHDGRQARLHFPNVRLELDVTFHKALPPAFWLDWTLERDGAEIAYTLHRGFGPRHFTFPAAARPA